MRTTSAGEDGLVRVRFELDPNEWHGCATEGLWAEPLGDHRYRLRNVPFYAFGVSVEDVVVAEQRDGQLSFVGVAERGGHSTYRVFVIDRAEFDRWWSPLRAIGCAYENGPALAVDIPPQTDADRAYALLEAGMAAGVWDFEEAHCGHPLNPVEEPQ